MIYLKQIESPIGILTCASDGQAITGLWIESQQHWGSTLSTCTCDGTDLPILKELQLWLEDYFAGKELCCLLPCKPEGTTFQREVWQQLRQIPYGITTTYGQIAKNLAQQRGSKISPQAVGNAVGRNPISILIPCHRVIGAKGNLIGYAGGLERKIFLLELEHNSKKLGQCN